jgi:hypothetical protein
VLSDLHAGSTFGLLNDGFETGGGNEIGLNACQRFLWECWLDATTKWLPEIASGDKYALVINGDLCEGNHHGTREIISPAEEDHTKAACELLAPLTKNATQTFITVGTECHTKKNESAIAKAIGATPDPNTGSGAWDKLYMNVAGIPCTFQHHISTTSRWHLRGSRLSIALANEQATAVNHGHMPPRVLGAAHCHIFDKYDNGKALCFTTGAWQFGTRHVGKVATAGLQRPEPTIAALDFRDTKDGELPRFLSRVYTAPEPKGVTL